MTQNELSDDEVISAFLDENPDSAFAVGDGPVVIIDQAESQTDSPRVPWRERLFPLEPPKPRARRACKGIQRDPRPVPLKKRKKELEKKKKRKN